MQNEVSGQEGREGTAEIIYVHSTTKEGYHKWRGLGHSTVLSVIKIYTLGELGPAV